MSFNVKEGQRIAYTELLDLGFEDGDVDDLLRELYIGSEYEEGYASPTHFKVLDRDGLKSAWAQKMLSGADDGEERKPFTLNDIRNAVSRFHNKHQRIRQR